MLFVQVRKSPAGKTMFKDLGSAVFFLNAEKIANIKHVLLGHETLIDSALTAYNALTQNAQDYGVSQPQSGLP